MQYRTYKETMLPQMVRLWKEEAVRIRYKAYDSPEEWKAELLDKPDFDPEGCILAFTDSGSLAGFAAAISQKEFLPGQNRDNTPGYIFLLVVKEEYEGRGVGSSLLEKAEAFLKGQGLSLIHIYVHKRYDECMEQFRKTHIAKSEGPEENQNAL